MYLGRVARLIVCAGIVGNGCVTTPSEPAKDYGAVSLQELRTARREPIPACAQRFTVCKGKACALRAGTFRPDEAGEWESCKPSVQQWEQDQLAIRNAIMDRDPLPACFDPGKRAYVDAGVSPYSPERNLVMLDKGLNLGTLDCTVKHCAWVARNAGDVERLMHVCAKAGEQQ